MKIKNIRQTGEKKEQTLLTGSIKALTLFIFLPRSKRYTANQPIFAPYQNLRIV